MAKYNYKPLNWEDPIWKTQNKEPPREAHYKDLFLNFNGTITDFAKEYLPELWVASVNDKDALRKNFDKYDIKKGEPPSFGMVRDWASAFFWRERRSAFKNSVTEEVKQSLVDTRIQLLKEYILNLQKIVPESIDAQLENMRILNDVLGLGVETSGKDIESRSKANLNIEEYLQKALGLDVEVREADDLNANDDESEALIPVKDNPDHEDKELHDTINSVLWEMVDNR